MLVSEVVTTLLELDQDSEIFFTHPEGSSFIYVVATLPQGARALCEMPTATIKNKEIKET